MFTSLLKDRIRDTDEWSDEEIPRARFGRVSSTGASVPVELRCVILLLDTFANLEDLLTLYYWDIMEASSHRHDQLLTPFPFPLPSLKDGGWG